MKKVTLLLLISVVYLSCKKDRAIRFQNEAVITGINVTQCPCLGECPCACGGLYFHFTDSVYSANIPLDNPAIFKLASNTQFPVYVKVNWINTSRCNTTAIKITGYQIE